MEANTRGQISKITLTEKQENALNQLAEHYGYTSISEYLESRIKEIIRNSVNDVNYIKPQVNPETTLIKSVTELCDLLGRIHFPVKRQFDNKDTVIRELENQIFNLEKQRYEQELMNYERQKQDSKISDLEPIENK